MSLRIMVFEIYLKAKNQLDPFWDQKNPRNTVRGYVMNQCYFLLSVS